MKNEANLKSQKFTATSCSIGGYNVLNPKTQNGTKPNKANLRQSRRSLGEDENPISKTENPSLFQGEHSLLLNLLLRNKPNFNHPKIPATSYITVAYNIFQRNPKNGANPNKPNQSQFQSLQFLRQKTRNNLAKNKEMKSKPNFFTTPKPHFSAELFSDTRLRQGPPASVLVYVEDWTASRRALLPPKETAKITQREQTQ